ncbi:hypothetical protein HDU79_003781 [Rhizoclosmatium sp. JEL0117]|nr:hypothetical protein HDU79_003781 [Rhizoclosmatium sp. JEL0117]
MAGDAHTQPGTPDFLVCHICVSHPEAAGAAPHDLSSASTHCPAFNDKDAILAAQRHANDHGNTETKVFTLNLLNHYYHIDNTTSNYTQPPLVPTQRLPAEKKENQQEDTVPTIQVSVSDEELGSGCFGVVYAGKYENTDVAIKTFGFVGALGPDLVKAIQEAHIWYSLKHPNITTLWGIAYDAKRRPMLVVDRMEMNLLERLKSNPTSRERIKWLIDISLAFQYLSSLNPPVVHRDLKPDNVFIGLKGSAYLSDFGMSRVQNLYNTSHDKAPTKGCLRYAPPESHALGYKATPKYDVFSYGMTMYEITTGHTAFVGEEMLDNVHVIHWICNGQRPDREGVKGHEPAAHKIPNALWNLIQRCWAQDANCRPDFTYIRSELYKISFLEDGNYDMSLQDQGSLRPSLSSISDEIDLTLLSREEGSIIYSYEKIAEGAYALAKSFCEGVSFEQSSEKAIMWFTYSANLGYPNAQFDLAEYYYQGIYVSKDLEKASKLFRLAAIQGHVHAQLRLGQCYQLGQGVEKNMAKAASLYHLVNQRADPKVAGFLDKVQKHIIKMFDFDEALINSIFIEKDE